MMTASDYKLFDGVDFGQFLFGSNFTANVHTEAPELDKPRCGGRERRPIVKSEKLECDVEVEGAATTDVITCTTPAATSCHKEGCGGAAVSGSRGRMRSSSCSSGGSDGGQGLLCVFCKRNGETREFFTTHTLKDWRGLIVCPVLRAYTCPKCGVSGDYAHTESHCPISGNSPSFMASLRTRRSSCGLRKYKN